MLVELILAAFTECNIWLLINATNK